MPIDAHAHILPGSFPAAPSGCDPASWPSMSPMAGEDARLLVIGPMRFPAKTVWFDAEQRLEAQRGQRAGRRGALAVPAAAELRVAGRRRAGPGPVGQRVHRGVVAAFPAGSTAWARCRCRTRTWPPAELTEVAKLGLAGVEIASNIDGVSLHDPRFVGFLAEAERLGTAVFVHGMPAPSDRLPGPAVATFGVGAEASLAAAAIITGGVAEKYPVLRISFSHAAGGFPLMLTRAQWFWGRTWNEEPPGERGPEAAPWFAEHGPTELARRFYYDSLVFDRRAIRYLADMLGTDRLLVGSDFPAMTREEPCRADAALDGAVCGRARRHHVA